MIRPLSGSTRTTNGAESSILTRGFSAVRSRTTTERTAGALREWSA